jgi:hypothetical protein
MMKMPWTYGDTLSTIAVFVSATAILGLFAIILSWLNRE